MGLIEATKDLKTGEHILYQDVNQGYEFRSGVVEHIFIDPRSSCLRLTSTDARTREENPLFPLVHDPVFYKVPVELLEGRLAASEVRDSIAEQNDILLPPELRSMGEMYVRMIEEQLEATIDAYIPKGRMPRLDTVDASLFLRP